MFLLLLHCRLMSDANIADRRVTDVNCTDAFTLPECDFELLPTTTSSCSAATNMYAGVNCTSSCELNIHSSYVCGVVN